MDRHTLFQDKKNIYLKYILINQDLGYRSNY
jgi:hypothetical protein